LPFRKNLWVSEYALMLGAGSNTAARTKGSAVWQAGSNPGAGLSPKYMFHRYSGRRLLAATGLYLSKMAGHDLNRSSADWENMKFGEWVLLCSLAVMSSAATALDHEPDPGFVHIQSGDVPYRPDPAYPGLGYAVLIGDPDATGIYVIRLKVPPGMVFPPHYHDQDRHITVISGVWAFGTGGSGKCEDTIPLTAGAYVFHPQGAVHFDGACGDGPVEVQIIGQGPVKTTFLAANPVEAKDMPDTTNMNEFAVRYAAAWSSQDPVSLASFYSENGALTVNDGAPSVGRAAIQQAAGDFMTAFPDMVVELTALERDGEKLVFHWHWTGTNTGPGGTGTAVDLNGYEVWTMDPDGLIAESLGHYDEAEYRSQVGLSADQ